MFSKISSDLVVITNTLLLNVKRNFLLPILAPTAIKAASAPDEAHTNISDLHFLFMAFVVYLQMRKLLLYKRVYTIPEKVVLLGLK